MMCALTQLGMEDLHDCQTGVEPNEVSQCERPHGDILAEAITFTRTTLPPVSLDFSLCRLSEQAWLPSFHKGFCAS